MKNLRASVALGRIAHDTVVVALGGRRSQIAFGHGCMQAIGAVTLFDSYHCSRYNTNTGVLTPQMFHDVFGKVRAHLGTPAPNR
jgi:uracil-DNA glycosylase